MKVIIEILSIEIETLIVDNICRPKTSIKSYPIISQTHPTIASHTLGLLLIHSSHTP